MRATNYKSPIEIFLILSTVSLMLLALSSCKYEQFKSYPYESTTLNNTSHISGGMRISHFDPIAYRTLYLAIDSKIYPTLTGFQGQQKDFCTAVAINPKIAITAAHCLLGRDPKSFHAIRGVSPWQNKIDPDQWHKSENFLIHPKFKTGHPSFDVGLILLSEPLPSQYVTGFAVDKLKSSEVVLAGFGFRTGLQLLGTAVQFHSHAGELFAVKHYVQEFIEDDLLLKLHSNAPIVCAGDSGSPMLVPIRSSSAENTNDIQDYALLGILAGGQIERATDPSSLGERATDPSSLGERATDPSSLGERATIVEQTCLNRALYVNLRHPQVFDWITSSLSTLNALIEQATK